MISTIVMATLWSLVSLLLSVQGQRLQPVTNDEIIAALAVSSSGTVCEIGAGDGALSVAIARTLGNDGHVLASELGDAHLTALRRAFDAAADPRLQVVAAGESSTNFADDACDAVLLKDVYHHLANPTAINQSMLRAIKPRGRIVIVDFTPPGEEAPRPSDRGNDGMHGIYPPTVERELKAAGFVPVMTNAPSDRRWFIVVMGRP